MTIVLDPVAEQRLQELAAEAGCEPSELAQEALSAYIAHMKSLAAELRDGEESTEREGWLTHDEVFERLNHRLQKTA